MRLAEVRRLTGRSLWLDGPGVGAELCLDDSDGLDELLLRLTQALRQRFVAFGVEVGPLVVRPHRGGVSLAMAAPEDALHTTADAFETVVRQTLDLPAADDEQMALDGRDHAAWCAAFAAERSPALCALLHAAAAREVPALQGDDELTLGLGAHSRSYPLQGLPTPSEVPWGDLSRVPVALVTGTNGKTTTTRLLARMAAEAGLHCGYTTTDGLFVGGDQLGEGDWSGPGGARSILRDDRVQLAVLETARGGMLRRGLALTDADVAVITNVSADHLGEYGIYTASDMVHVKCLVAKGLRQGGLLVLNADDEVLMIVASHLPNPKVLFSRHGEGEALEAHLVAGGEAWTVEEDVLVHRTGLRQRVPWLDVTALPMSFHGTAGFNIENLLAASAAAVGLGLPLEAIERGLRGFDPNRGANPGRLQLLTHDGTRLVLDFAHNAAGIDALFGWAASWRKREGASGRLFVVAGLPGDRRDDEIRAVGERLSAGAADRYYLRDLIGYQRGRQALEVPMLLQTALHDAGIAPEQIVLCSSDVDALGAALDDAGSQDTVLLLAVVQLPEVEALLTARGWTLGDR